MAGSQFITPPKVTPSRPVRRFSLEQANRSLPLVQRIVQDIVTVHRRITQLQSQAEALTGREQADAEKTLQASLDRLHELVAELTDIGCEIKDYEIGLIDFVARHQDRDVYLCWKLGEANITHWHELHSGFAGRQPVSMLEEAE